MYYLQILILAVNLFKLWKQI